MLKIGEAAALYGVSNRTLRFWEDAGLLKSCRMANDYRYYDEQNLKKIEQILLLRKIDLPIRDIQRIFVTGELSAAVGALEAHLKTTNRKADELGALGAAIGQLLAMLQADKSLRSESSLGVDDANAAETDASEAVVVRRLTSALKKVLSERAIGMSGIDTSSNEVRIIRLPKLIVASYGVVSDTPEDDCWGKVGGLIKKYALDQESGFRYFGFGFSDDKGKYGYEMWVMVPEDLKVPEPFIRKEFPGGLFAALPANLSVIGERWDLLQDWIVNSEDFEVDSCPEKMRYCLEECLDYVTFHAKETPDARRQLDLLSPVRRISSGETMNGDCSGKPSSGKAEVMLELEPRRVALPDVTLAGCCFEQKAGALPWKKHVPWYRLAQAIYRTGPDFKARMIMGNYTFTLLCGHYGREEWTDRRTQSSSSRVQPSAQAQPARPFYLAGKEGTVAEVFVAVEISRPFESYPEELLEQVLPARDYLVFAAWIDPEIVTRKKLPSNKLYSAAAEYVAEHNCKVAANFCLEREYRADGQNVDRIELYVPLI